MPKYFGDVDRNKKGEIGSQYPSWYFEQQQDELRESMEFKKRAIERGSIPKDSVAETLADIAREEQRLREIEQGRPRLKDSELDEVAKTREEIGAHISEALFTRTEESKNLTSGHEEARRMMKPCIKVTSDAMARACKDCGVTIKDGMITRNEAAKVWKIMGKLIGEDTNVERLRRD